ncbi:SpoIIE family protein phosphatase [Streptomyces sp. NPDC005925]|uniref:SpoIIE family protein phosphatase n=1 Tax=Streptomyces sp. NPDC005925 TaxID=3157172 RepID=UPI0033F5579D
MGSPDPPGALRSRFPRSPRSAASARSLVADALGACAPDVVHTARLLAGELVTNALLHAATEVEVAAWTMNGRACVRVGDHRPSRAPVPHDLPPYAGTGQGLALVRRLASRHGVESDACRKTVWFELWPEGPPAPPSEPPSEWRSPAASTTDDATRETVTLVDVPAALCSASLQHRHALLREVLLAVAGGTDLGVAPEDLAVALDTNNVISACVTAALLEQPSGTDMRALPLVLPADTAPEVRTLRRVLDAAERAAREGALLTLPALPRVRFFQEWLFDQIVGQSAGGRPMAWTLVPRVPGAGPSELAPWDAAHARTGRTPTVAADESNRIVAVNGPAAELLGWHADDLVGRKLTTLIPEHLRERHLSAFTSLLLTGESRIVDRSVPLPALHHDGHHIPVRLFVQTQEMADGRTVFVAQLTPRAAASPEIQPTPHVPSRQSPPRPDPPSSTTAAEHPAHTEHPAAEAGMSALDRLSLLAETSGTLSTTMDLEEGLRTVGRLLTRRLADWCAVDLLTEDSQVDRVCVVHREPGELRPETYEGRLPPVDETTRGPLARVLRGAGPLLLPQTFPSQAAGRLDAGYRQLFRHLDATSAIVAPLRARREIVGALTVARTGGRRPFGEEDLSLVDDLVRTLALGVDNARLYQDTRHVAERLQRSMLPVLPDIPYLGLAARYAASSTTTQVGGDWYDSFLLPSGHPALVIGDVTGHNLDATIAMSQLRSMLRGIAVDRQEPPETVLRRLDLANHTLYREATATCIYGLLRGGDTGPWELDWSSAGHLPPLLTAADGGTRYLSEGSGLLLGMDPEAARQRATCAVPAGSTLLFFTDGLIERRGEHLDEALDRLRGRTADLAREPLDVFCDELLIGLGADNDDDIAILAVRVEPQDG